MIQINERQLPHRKGGKKAKNTASQAVWNWGIICMDYKMIRESFNKGKATDL